MGFLRDVTGSTRSAPPPTGTSDRSDDLAWPLVAALLAAALVVRLVMMRLSPGLSFGDLPEYAAGAQRLLERQPLPQKNILLFIRAPGYSLFIALVWLLSGTRSVVAIKLVQCGLGTATCWYVYRLARQLGARQLGSACALAGAAFYPYLVYQSVAPGSEALFSLFVVASTYQLAKVLRQPTPSLPGLLLAGVLLAAGNLVRPNLSTVLPLLAVWLIARFAGRPLQIVRIGAALMLSIALVTLPWTYTVYRQGYGLMWVTDGAGVYYWLGHNDVAEQLYCGHATAAERRQIINAPPFNDLPEFLEAQRQPPRSQAAAKLFWQRAREWDRAHPGSQACLIRGKALGYLRPWVDPTVFPRSQVLLSLAALPVLLLGVAGLWLARRRGEREVTTLILLNAVTGFIAAVLCSTEVRYRIPITDLPLLACAGYALERLYDVALRRSA